MQQQWLNVSHNIQCDSLGSLPVITGSLWNPDKLPRSFPGFSGQEHSLKTTALGNEEGASDYNTEVGISAENWWHTVDTVATDIKDLHQSSKHVRYKTNFFFFKSIFGSGFVPKTFSCMNVFKQTDTLFRISNRRIGSWKVINHLPLEKPCHLKSLNCHTKLHLGTQAKA